jgi:hypothetical protein
MRLFTSLSLLPYLVILVSAEHRTSKRNHVAVGKREGTGLSVSRRGGDAQFTYYQVGFLCTVTAEYSLRLLLGRAWCLRKN